MLSIELKRKPTESEIEAIVEAAEQAARRFVLSEISLKKISDLSVTVEAIGDKPLTLSVGVALELANEKLDPSKTVDEASDAAFEAAERKAKELKLCVDKSD